MRSNTISNEAVNVENAPTPALSTTLADLADTVAPDLAAYIRAYPDHDRDAADQPSEADPLPIWQAWIDGLAPGSSWRSTSGIWVKGDDGLRAPSTMGMGLAVSAYYVRNSAPYTRCTEVQS